MESPGLNSCQGWTLLPYAIASRPETLCTAYQYTLGAYNTHLGAYSMRGEGVSPVHGQKRQPGSPPSSSVRARLGHGLRGTWRLAKRSTRVPPHAHARPVLGQGLLGERPAPLLPGVQNGLAKSTWCRPQQPGLCSGCLSFLSVPPFLPPSPGQSFPPVQAGPAAKRGACNANAHGCIPTCMHAKKAPPPILFCPPARGASPSPGGSPPRRAARLLVHPQAPPLPAGPALA